MEEENVSEPEEEEENEHPNPAQSPVSQPNPQDQYPVSPEVRGQSGIRRSNRDRRPRLRLTYDSLGEPSVQEQVTVNSVLGHTLQYSPVVHTPHCTPTPRTLMQYLSPFGMPYSHPIYYTHTPYTPYPYHTPNTHISR